MIEAKIRVLFLVQKRCKDSQAQILIWTTNQTLIESRNSTDYNGQQYFIKYYKRSNQEVGIFKKRHQIVLLFYQK